MTALDRLRALEISQEAASHEPTKPTKPPFDGFVGTSPPILSEYLQGARAHSVANDSGPGPDVERRRALALALLDAEPDRQIAVIAEAGDPAHVAIAIRGAAVGEIEIAADRYDGFALLALMEQHGHA
jgi:hypothetical protein